MDDPATVVDRRSRACAALQRATGEFLLVQGCRCSRRGDHAIRQAANARALSRRILDERQINILARYTIPYHSIALAAEIMRTAANGEMRSSVRCDLGEECPCNLLCILCLP
jgi:hypothetical protein